LKVHEVTTAAGELAPVYLTSDQGTLAIDSAEGAGPLPPGALEAVMKRFGAPFEIDEPLSRVAALDLGGGRVLHHVRHLARYDVIAKDYLLYERPDGEALGALATTVTAALSHLARAAASAR
jgi:Ca2+-binding RTX toxin-like protein